jgi:hypothetical protein
VDEIKGGFGTGANVDRRFQGFRLDLALAVQQDRQ